MDEKYKEQLKKGFASLIEALMADLANKEKFSPELKNVISKGSYYGSLFLMNQVEKEYEMYQEMKAKLNQPFPVPKGRLYEIVSSSPNMDSAINTIAHELVSGRLKFDA